MGMGAVLRKVLYAIETRTVQMGKTKGGVVGNLLRFKEISIFLYIRFKNTLACA